jgi:hypothetical protein
MFSLPRTDLLLVANLSINPAGAKQLTQARGEPFIEFDAGSLIHTRVKARAPLFLLTP